MGNSVGDDALGDDEFFLCDRPGDSQRIQLIDKLRNEPLNARVWNALLRCRPSPSHVNKKYGPLLLYRKATSMPFEENSSNAVDLLEMWFDRIQLEELPFNKRSAFKAMLKLNKTKSYKRYYLELAKFEHDQGTAFESIVSILEEGCRQGALEISESLALQRQYHRLARTSSSSAPKTTTRPSSSSSSSSGSRVTATSNIKNTNLLFIDEDDTILTYDEAIVIGSDAKMDKKVSPKTSYTPLPRAPVSSTPRVRSSVSSLAQQPETPAAASASSASSTTTTLATGSKTPAAAFRAKLRASTVLKNKARRVRVVEEEGQEARGAEKDKSNFTNDDDDDDDHHHHHQAKDKVKESVSPPVSSYDNHNSTLSEHDTTTERRYHHVHDPPPTHKKPSFSSSSTQSQPPHALVKKQSWGSSTGSSPKSIMNTSVVSSSSSSSSSPTQSQLPAANPFQTMIAPKNCIRVRETLYLKLDEIGRGGTSKVFRVLGPDYRMFALKKIKMKSQTSEFLELVQNEIHLLERLRGQPRIIHMRDYEINLEAKHILIVFEFGEMDLHHRLEEMRNQSQTLDLHFVRLIWKHMLEAVHSIHEARIVHGDLKGNLKLIDFGIAKAIENDTTNIVRDATTGTINYMSPEAIQTTNKLKIGRSSDIWSLGCILYQIVTGRPPFASLRSMIQKFQAIINPAFDIDYTQVDAKAGPALGRVIRRCLQREPKSRPNIFPDLLHDAFLTSTDHSMELRQIVEGVSGSSPEAIKRQILEKLDGLEPHD